MIGCRSGEVAGNQGRVAGGDQGATRSYILVEPNPGGHRFSYVAVLAEAALAEGDTVRLVTRVDAAAASQWTLLQSAIKNGLLVEFTSDFSPAGLAQLTQRLHPSAVVVPDADRFVARLLSPGQWRSSALLVCLIMRPLAQPRTSAVVTLSLTLARRALFWLASRRRRVRVVYLRSALQRADDQRGRWAVDPVIVGATDDQAERYRLARGIAPSDTVFAIVGAIDERKNVALVVDALVEAGVPNGVLLLAGRVADSARASVDDAIKRGAAGGLKVILDDRTLPDVELDSALVGADCLVLAYSNEGPSGILGKAAAAGTPVLAAGASSLRKEAGVRPDLISWVPLDVVSLADGLRVRGTQRSNRASDSPTGEFRSVQGFVEPLLRRWEVS